MWQQSVTDVNLHVVKSVPENPGIPRPTKQGVSGVSGTSLVILGNHNTLTFSFYVSLSLDN